MLKIIASAPIGCVLAGHTPLLYPECLWEKERNTIAAAIRPPSGRRWITLQPIDKHVKPGTSFSVELAAHCHQVGPGFEKAVYLITENLPVKGHWIIGIKPTKHSGTMEWVDKDMHAEHQPSGWHTDINTDILLAIAGALNTMSHHPLSLIKLAGLVCQAEYLATRRPSEFASRVAALTGGIVMVRHDPVRGASANSTDLWKSEAPPVGTHGASQEWKVDERGLITLFA